MKKDYSWNQVGKKMIYSYEWLMIKKKNLIDIFITLKNN